MPANPLNVKQQFLPTDNIRLEVETTPTTNGGLANLCLNPSGDLGAWGWTATNGTLNIGGVSGVLGLRYTQSGASAGALRSYFMPITATQWVSARWDLLSVAASRNVKARFEWYDNARTLLSSTADTGTGTAAGTFFAIAAQAPANTKYVRLVLWLYNGTSGAASSGETFVVRNVMVTKATSSSAFIAAVGRTNLCTNPSFETNATGWTARSNCTIARSTARADVGTASLAVTFTAAGTATVQSPTFAVTAGKDYYASIRAYGATARGVAITSLYWLDASGGVISGSAPGFYNTETASTWTTIPMNYGAKTAPSGAVNAYLVFAIAGGAAAEVHYLDALIVEQTTATTRSYFDGATAAAGGWSYAWTGTAHASTSTASQASYAYVDPRSFQNVLGGSHEINLSRAPLDASTMTATIVDPALDPTDNAADVLAVGRTVRAMALVGTVWEPLYVGSIDDVVTSYVMDKEAGTVKPRIELHATDAAQTLANFKAPDGFDQLSGLTTTALPATNVPYLVDGVSWPDATAPAPCAKNADASVLDQIAIARDTVRGRAYVDRRGRFQAWDRGYSPMDLNPDLGTPIGTNGTVAGNGSTGTITATGAGDVTFTRDYPVEAGQPYVFNVGLTTTGTARSYSASVDWLQLDYVTTIPGATLTATATEGGTPASISADAPQGAYGARVTVTITASAAAQAHTYTLAGAFQNTRYTSVPSDAASANGDSYTDIDVSFATHACINTVSVLFNRYDAVTQQTAQIPYGPYVDQNSVDKNGPYSATFTIQGGTESTSAIQDYALAVLTANANPARQANSITVAVLDDKGIRHAVLNDLCTPVHVSYYDTAASGYLVDSAVRIETIQHNITPSGWTVTYTFTPTDSVAAPQVTPVPTNAPVGRAWYTLTHQANNTLTTGSWTRLSGMGVLGSGGNIGANSASILIAEPGWYHVSGAVNHAWSATANRCGALIDVAANVGDAVVGAPNADGSGGIQLLLPRTSTAALVVSLSGTLYCDAGQYIRLWAYQDNGANQTLAASGSTYVKAVKIS